jgi:hypothetical protein
VQPTLPVAVSNITHQQPWAAEQANANGGCCQPAVQDGFIQAPQFALPDQNFDLNFNDLDMVAPVDPLSFDSFDLGSDMMMSTDTNNLNLSEYILPDLTQTMQGAGANNNLSKPEDEQGGGGGGGGCCCGGG